MLETYKDGKAGLKDHMRMNYKTPLPLTMQLEGLKDHKRVNYDTWKGSSSTPLPQNMRFKGPLTCMSFGGNASSAAERGLQGSPV